VHVDGLEWKRAKWSGAGRRYYQVAEKLAVRWADQLIADARGIQDYYRDTHAAQTVFIPYGTNLPDGVPADRVAELDLSPGRYHLVVARMEPENNVHLIVEGYVQSSASLPLVVVGSAPYGDDYAATVRAAARGQQQVQFVGSVWDQQLLDALYANSATYLHGHSVGGTNPSLLRAMGAGAPTIAVDVVFNREVLGDTGAFFTTPASLAALLEQAESAPDVARRRGEAGRDRALACYDWEEVAGGYEQLCLGLARGPRRSHRERARHTNGNQRGQRKHQVGLFEPDPERPQDEGESK
jgi:glycosyltransferase involved in cell wall biosynthesis